MAKMREFDKKWMAARAWYTAGRTIDWNCPRCGANGGDMADKCRAALADPCPGFVQIEKVHREFAEKWRALASTDEVENG